jgi:hypothetical protein
MTNATPAPRVLVAFDLQPNSSNIFRRRKRRSLRLGCTARSSAYDREIEELKMLPLCCWLVGSKRTHGLSERARAARHGHDAANQRE